MESKLKLGDLILCTVKSISSGSVSVEIENNGLGTIIMSEIAAGRIRNIREYVMPNKKIVCKVLKILPDHIELSLRRVTGKEREFVQERYKKGRTFSSLLGSICKNKENILEKIGKEYEIWDFYDQLKANPELIAPFISKEEAEKIKLALKSKDDSIKQAKKAIFLKSYSASGLSDIQSALNHTEADIHYLGSSQFSIQTKAKDFKEANHKLLEIIKVIEHTAKDKKMQFELKEAK